MRLLLVGALVLGGSCTLNSDREVVIITATPPDPSSATATFAFTAGSESGVTFTCALDGNPGVACTSPVTYTDLADYEHAFTVRAESWRGSGEATARWRVDLEPPQRQVVTIHDRSYVAYQAPGRSFRFVCAEPCAIDDRYLQARYQGFRRVHAPLVAAMGIDVLPELWPVDMHVSADAECPVSTTFTGYSFWDPVNHPKPTVCLFDLEAANARPPIVPRPLTVDNALALRNQVLAAHEYGHTVLFKRHTMSHEWLVQTMSFFVTGQSPTPCDERFANGSGSTTGLELCVRNGYRFEDLAPSLQALEALYQSGRGDPDWGGATTTSQLRHILDQRLGSSTFQAFLDGGYTPPTIGEDPYTLTPAGGHLVLYDGWLTLDVPEDAVTAPITIDYHAPLAAYTFPSQEWVSLEFDTMYPLAPRGAPTPLARPISITIRYDPALVPAGGDASKLWIYDSWATPPFSLAATNVVVDQVNHTVTGQISALATYAVMPPP